MCLHNFVVHDASKSYFPFHDQLLSFTNFGQIPTKVIYMFVFFARLRLEYKEMSFDLQICKYGELINPSPLCICHYVGLCQKFW